MTVMLLIEDNLESLSLKRGCTDSPESTNVKMPHWWKSHVTAQLFRIHVESVFVLGQNVAEMCRPFCNVLF